MPRDISPYLVELLAVHGHHDAHRVNAQALHALAASMTLLIAWIRDLSLEINELRSRPRPSVRSSGPAFRSELDERLLRRNKLPGYPIQIAKYAAKTEQIAAALTDEQVETELNDMLCMALADQEDAMAAEAELAGLANAVAQDQADDQADAEASQSAATDPGSGDGESGSQGTGDGGFDASNDAAGDADAGAADGDGGSDGAGSDGGDSDGGAGGGDGGDGGGSGP